MLVLVILISMLYRSISEKIVTKYGKFEFGVMVHLKGRNDGVERSTILSACGIAA